MMAMNIHCSSCRALGSVRRNVPLAAQNGPRSRCQQPMSIRSRLFDDHGNVSSALFPLHTDSVIVGMP